MRILPSLLALLATSAAAEVQLAPLFQNHAVLQAGKPLPVWGRAAPGEKVSIDFHQQHAATTADAAGRWRITLPPLPVDAQPSTLIASGDANRIVLSDILLGEVWLCAGQSNMEFVVSRGANGEAETAAANDPLLRHFGVRKRLSTTPLDSLDGAWQAAAPDTAGKFTAVGYYFARELRRELGVPVGLLHASWGGTDIEGWMSPESITPDSAVWPADGPPHQKRPSNLFNAMVKPLAPAALAGVLWYQGENNVGRAQQYRQLFPALITGWRQQFEQPALPFYWVQLPDFRGSGKRDDWAEMREAQGAPLALPATAQAITIGLGERDDIHPHNKQDVGRRLALIALAQHYGKPVVASGPQFSGARFSSGEAKLSFAPAASALRLDDASGFELAGADRRFHAAAARIDGGSVIVSTPEVPQPVAVRYAWHNVPQVTLFNTAGLPAAPFRSDDW